MSFKSKIKLEQGFAEIRKAIQAELSPFGLATPAQRRKRKQDAVDDLETFAKTYFPHYLQAEPSLMHRELYKEFQRVIDKSQETGEGTKEAHAAPRGNAKSTITTLILPLWCVATNRRQFITNFSDTTDQAKEFLEFIKAELEVNERLAEDFPKICGPGSTWQVGEIITRNLIKIKCWGKGKRVRGARHLSRRPDLVICDDLEDDQSVVSPEQRAKDRNWFFRAVMKCGAKYTVTIVIGTILHYASLLSELLKQPGWIATKWKAVIEWSDSPLWERWENIFTADGEEAADKFFAAHRQEMLQGTEVLWPEVEDYYYLMKMRVSDGPAYFDSEKQNEPINPDDCLFVESWFVIVDEEEIRHNLNYQGYKETACAVDPSMGKRGKNNDPSAILIGGVRPDGLIDILEADIKKRHPDAIMDWLFEYHKTYGFSRIAVEEVQFQELFKDQCLKEGARRGIYLPIQGTRPVMDKTLRITKLQPHIRNGLIRFRRSQTMLLDQLKYFPKADHDDGPDALEMLFTLISQGASGPRLRRIA